MTINPVAVIEKKRDGGALSEGEISGMVRGYVDGTIADYQMAAFCMAVYFSGMSDAELLALLDAFVRSGDKIDLSSVPGIKVDKHSTGGVGDKVSLILVPLVAAAGVAVPMMAGRGLGHTGGTLDKLESIPGFSTVLSAASFRDQVRNVGCAIMGQTERIVPADRKIYALRDVTGTVPSIPLIASSILGKKIAEGADALVFDVKLGSGAFLKTREEAVRLAKTLTALGNGAGLRTIALLTAMDQPLGSAVGNWLEVLEAVEVLRGGGPADTKEVTLALGGEMLALAGKAETPELGIEMLAPLLSSGAAFAKFIDMVRAQGGNAETIEHPERIRPAPFIVTVPSPGEGWVSGLDAREVGVLSVALGAGRTRKEDAVDPAAGIALNKKIVDRVAVGDSLAVIHTNRAEIAERAAARLAAAYKFQETPAARPRLIDSRI
jgi:pyrimidine-nucleoside phosphorylase